VPHGAPAAAVAHELVEAMSSPSLAGHVQLPSWDSCADQLAHVYLSSLRVSPGSRPSRPRTRDTRGHADRDGMGARKLPWLRHGKRGTARSTLGTQPKRPVVET
jgi:hypothetical protein